MSARYDITANQGETLNLHLLYTDTNDSAIDLSSYVGEMKVKRTFLGDTNILHLYSGTTIGITSGITGSTGGITGGLFLNRNVGNSGSQTGGILLIAGSTATSFFPTGKHSYDIEIKYTPTGAVTRLIEGRFDVTGETTR
jgi:hypothetical protein|tara:strand:+ start:303 stop:722 length:420 start_codon:yes stop_codon:yes gene_type:complete